MDVYVDNASTMAALGEVAVWTFELAHWGECAQSSDESDALRRFAFRVGADDLRVAERVTGHAQVFLPDLIPATDDQVQATLRVLSDQRARALEALESTPRERLAVEDDSVKQPQWMSWRTPASILWHIADTESRAYPRWVGLPERAPLADLRAELLASATHIRGVLHEMPRDLVAEHRGETWTAVKLLRRLAWHERVELVFLRRRLRAANSRMGAC